MRFYTLAPMNTEGAASGNTPPAIRVVRVTLPGEIDRPELVRRMDATRLQLAEEDRWGAPLGEMIQRVLSADLQSRVPATASEPDQLVVEIEEFIADANCAVTLRAAWDLKSASGAAAQPVRGYETVRAEPSGTCQVSVLPEIMSARAGRACKSRGGCAHEVFLTFGSAARSNKICDGQSRLRERVVVLVGISIAETPPGDSAIQSTRRQKWKSCLGESCCTFIAFLALFVLAPVHAQVSSGMAGDYKRGSPFTVNQLSVLSRLQARLDGFGGPQTGYQADAMIVYLDDNGAPGPKLIESDPVRIYALAPDRWVEFYTRPISYNPANTGSSCIAREIREAAHGRNGTQLHGSVGPTNSCVRGGMQTTMPMAPRHLSEPPPRRAPSFSSTCCTSVCDRQGLRDARHPRVDPVEQAERQRQARIALRAVGSRRACSSCPRTSTDSEAPAELRSCVTTFMTTRTECPAISVRNPTRWSSNPASRAAGFPPTCRRCCSIRVLLDRHSRWRHRRHRARLR